MSTSITISIDLDLLQRLKEVAHEQSTATKQVTYGDLIRDTMRDTWGGPETAE